MARSPSQLTPFPGSEGISDHARAAQAVRDFRNITVGKEDVQKALLDRLGKYPGDWKKFQHYAHYQVPPKIQRLLRASPQLAPDAIRAFHERDVIDSRALRVMKNFPPTPSGGGLVRVGLTLSKCLYSMLATQKYKADKRSGWPSLEACDNEADRQSLDLGIKLTCGFEILASDIKSTPDGGNEGDSAAMELYVASLKDKGYFQNELEGSKRYQELLRKAKEYFHVTHSAESTVDRALKAVLLDETEAVGERIDCNDHRSPEDDSWMQFDNKSFDDMLASHFNLKQQVGSMLTNVIFVGPIVL